MIFEKNGVAEKIAEKCRIAYQAGKPLILIDTEEIELAEAAAVKSGTVDLLRPVESSAADRFWQPYYRFLREEEDPELCDNFFTGDSRLPELIAQSGNPVSGLQGGTPGLFVLHLTSQSWKRREHAPSTISLLRSYVKAYTHCRDRSSPLRASCVILFGDVSLLPEDLLLYTELIEEDYPDAQELMELVARMAADYGTPIELRADVEAIARSLSGFHLMEAQRIMQRLLCSTASSGQPLLFTKERDQIILEAKKQVLLRNGGLLELYRQEQVSSRADAQPQTADQLGGMHVFRQWIRDNENRILRSDQYLLHRGIQRLKGILLCGVPGCGKSEAAKILHQTWGLPMVKMSVDRLMGGLVGDSERNMRQALRQAEAMAPCILWIDEMDKGFSGSARGNQDDTTFKRMFGYFLDWMQSNRRPCFIYATANDIGQLPPEFFRSGRFDALYSVFMPTEYECMEIFREQMRRLTSRSDEEAGRWGASGTKLFEQGCFSDEVMKKIMGCFLEPRTLEINANIKFVNGADIEKIVENAMMRVRADTPARLPAADDENTLQLSAPITQNEWIASVRSVIQDPTVSTYGGSPANLNSLTACYIRLLRGNFVPAGRELLDKNAYQTVWDEEKGRYSVLYQPNSEELDRLSPYDRALHDAIASRIGSVAALMENRELQKLIG